MCFVSQLAAWSIDGYERETEREREREKERDYHKYSRERGKYIFPYTRVLSKVIKIDYP